MSNKSTKNELTEDQKNLDFVQVYTEVFQNFADLTKKNPLSAQILFFLIQHMAAHNNAVCVSYATLTELLGYSRQTLTKAIKTLENEKYIQIIKQGTSNVYVINEKVAWRRARNERQYALFSATVIATSSENQKAIDQLNSGKSRKLRHVPRPYLEPKAEIAELEHKDEYAEYEACEAEMEEAFEEFAQMMRQGKIY